MASRTRFYLPTTEGISPSAEGSAIAARLGDLTGNASIQSRHNDNLCRAAFRPGSLALIFRGVGAKPSAADRHVDGELREMAREAE